MFDLAILMQTLEIVIWGRSNAMPEERSLNAAADQLVDTSVNDTARIIAVSRPTLLEVSEVESQSGSGGAKGYPDSNVEKIAG